MRLRGIGVGDLILVDRKGRLFHAEVRGKSNLRDELDIKPLERNVSYFTATARDVVAHWKRVIPIASPRARSRPRELTPPAYAELGELNP